MPGRKTEVHRGTREICCCCCCFCCDGDELGKTVCARESCKELGLKFLIAFPSLYANFVKRDNIAHVR